MDILQIILLSLYGVLAVWDSLNPNIGFNSPIPAGFFTGLLLGDPGMGLAVGGTLQLMILGVGTYGGSSIPDYMTGAVVGTAFAITSGKGMEVGLAISVPVGLLMVQMDILGRFCNTYFQHFAEKGAEERNYRKVELGNVLGIFPWGLSRAIPIFLVLLLGQDIVEQLLAVAPEWLMNGLKVAGGMLPSVGIAILLKYMPVKKFWMYVLLGFTLVSYLSLPVLGVALIGVFLAGLAFMKTQEAPIVSTTGVVVESVEGGTIEDDE